MDKTTPFSDAIETTSTSPTKSEVDILRDSNRELKLEIIELKEILEDQINAKQIAQETSDKFQAEYYSLRNKLNEIKTILKCN
jgi:predicted nuclease with TOPRIM domain